MISDELDAAMSLNDVAEQEKVEISTTLGSVQADLAAAREEHAQLANRELSFTQRIKSAEEAAGGLRLVATTAVASCLDNGSLTLSQTTHRTLNATLHEERNTSTVLVADLVRRIKTASSTIAVLRREHEDDQRWMSWVEGVLVQIAAHVNVTEILTLLNSPPPLSPPPSA